MKFTYLFSTVFFILTITTANTQDCNYVMRHEPNAGITGPGIQSFFLEELNYTIDASQTNLIDNQAWVKGLEGNTLEFRNTGGEVIITTPTIPIGYRELVKLQLQLRHSENLESDDYLKFFYQLDDEELIPVPNASFTGNFNDNLIYTPDLDATGAESLRIVIKCNNNATNEFIQIRGLNTIIEQYPILYGFTEATQTVNESDAHFGINVKVYQSHSDLRGISFGSIQEIIITDTGTGTATPNEDYNFETVAYTYSTYAPQSFGERCGSTENVSLSILADNDPNEEPETIVLQLTVTGSNFETRQVLHTITINETQNSALSLELMDFSAHPTNDDQILIKWQTANEEGVNAYILEHSYNGIDFQTIDEQSSKGTSIYYEFLHQPYAKGKQFYRLTQRDFAGKTHQSIVINTTLKIDNIVSIANNPVTSHLIINNISQPTTAIIYNNMAQPIRQFHLSQNNPEISVHDLATGTYILQLSTTDNLLSEIFIKH